MEVWTFLIGCYGMLKKFLFDHDGIYSITAKAMSLIFSLFDIACCSWCYCHNIIIIYNTHQHHNVQKQSRLIPALVCMCMVNCWFTLFIGSGSFSCPMRCSILTMHCLSTQQGIVCFTLLLSSLSSCSK